MIYRCIDKALADGIQMGLKDKYHLTVRLFHLPVLEIAVTCIFCSMGHKSHGNITIPQGYQD
jgi:hypothetical protein